MKALIIGATGATGTDLVKQLLEDSKFRQVVVFVRKALSFKHDKLVEHIVDFEHPRNWNHLVQGDVAFSAMGTTLKTAGSKKAQWKVDYDYQYNFSKVASENAVPVFVLVSAAYVSPDSKLFYPKMKGKLEEAVKKLHFTALQIFNPPVLARAGSDRSGEVIAVKIMNFLNGMGLFKKHRPMQTSELAAAMIRAVKKATPGIHQWQGQDILKA